MKNGRFSDDGRGGIKKICTRITLCTHRAREKKNGEEANQFSPQLRHFTRRQRRRFLRRRQLFLLARLPPTIHAMRRRRRRRRNKSGKFHRYKTIRADRLNGFSPHQKLFSYKNISMPLAPRPILLHYARCHGRSQEAHFRAQLCGEGWDG